MSFDTLCAPLEVGDTATSSADMATAPKSQFLPKATYVPIRPRSMDWAAGFADGEGCFCIFRPKLRSTDRNPTYRLIFSIAQNNLPVLEHFRWVLGVPGKIYATKRAANHRRQCFSLVYTGSTAVMAIALLAPHLVRKFEEAQKSLAFWVEGRCGVPGRGRLPEEVAAVREHYYQELKRLK